MRWASTWRSDINSDCLIEIHVKKNCDRWIKLKYSRGLVAFPLIVLIAISQKPEGPENLYHRDC